MRHGARGLYSARVRLALGPEDWHELEEPLRPATRLPLHHDEPLLHAYAPAELANAQGGAQGKLRASDLPTLTAREETLL